LRDGVLSHGNAARSCEIILRDGGTCQFVMSAHEIRGHVIDGLCHAAAVAIVQEGDAGEGNRK
jgi:hypothetical protein